MEQLEGLGKIDRERLAALMRGTKGTISVGEASSILRVSPSDAAKMLARWAKKGWLSRVRRGLYVSVPLESRTPDVPLEDPWVIAVRLFNPYVPIVILPLILNLRITRCSFESHKN